MTSTRISQFSIFVTLVLVIAAGVVHAQTFSVLYNFGSNTDDPSKPAYSGIIAQGRDGNLYSTAPGGGTCCGAVFQITPAGKLKNIHNFTGSNKRWHVPPRRRDARYRWQLLRHYVRRRLGNGRGSIQGDTERHLHNPL